jgi:uncharacterized membrane protein (Fun14 family)
LIYVWAYIMWLLLVTGWVYKHVIKVIIILILTNIIIINIVIKKTYVSLKFEMLTKFIFDKVFLNSLD